MVDLEIQSNLRRKKLHRMSQGSNLLGGSFSNSNNVRAQPNLEERVNPNTLKEDFFSRTDQFIFTSILSVFLDQSKETSPVFSSIEINKPPPAPVHFVL